ncbi:unnamed protein product [marine sediment metagenome]|uniref:Uncharacterized protein n=1 Tax=marine sediment metagenome TaxID=412755 RepID=X1GJI8_9ZZZZ
MERNRGIVGPIDKISNIRVDLGPRIIMVGIEVLGTADNILILVAEASKEGLEKLKSSNEIRLVRMP